MVSLKGSKVYLDASTIIYLLEGLEPHLQTGLPLPLDAGAFTAVTSEIAVFETVVGPRKAGDQKLLQEFRAFLTPSANFAVLPVSLQVIEKAIDLRARYGWKTPYAIHLPTGLMANCHLFVTADRSWSTTGVTVMNPADVAP